MRVVLKRADAEKRQVTLRYYDAPKKNLEVWAAGQLIGQLGDGRTGNGWVDVTMDLPVIAEDSMEILIKSTGTSGAGVVRLGVASAP